MPAYRGEDGALLHYDVVGDPSATPVIVLAGGAARHPEYLGDLAGLGQRWQLVIPHLRGVGRSPAPSDVEQGSCWRQAGDVERLRRHLGLDVLLLAGHSAGTRVAVSYAATTSERLAGLVLITPPASYLVDVPSDADALIDSRRGEAVFASALHAFTAGPDTASNETFDAWQQAIAPAGYATWGEAEQAHAQAARYDMAAARAFFSVPPPEELVQALGLVTAPVLVIAGAQDCITGVAPVRALAALFPNGQCVVIDASGHYPWVEQPLAFRQAVDAFLERLD